MGKLKKPGKAIAGEERANNCIEVFCIPPDLKALQNATRTSAVSLFLCAPVSGVQKEAGK